MALEWFEPKNQCNIRERGIDFASAEAFEWPTAIVLEDTRHDYGEQRFRATGMLHGKLHVLVFALRHDNIRIISLRRANKREEKNYVQTSQA